MAKELLKIKTYRAPRDKIICVLNCCKVIFGRRIRFLSCDVMMSDSTQVYYATQKRLIPRLTPSYHS